MDEQTPEPVPEPAPQKVSPELSEALRKELLAQQDVAYAIVGGLAASIVGAILWAVITVSTKHQIGYMAIGVGLLAGFSVRLFGGGIETYFGIIGAFFALLGCLLGNLLTQVGFIAQSESLGYFETITLLNFDLITEIYTGSFSPMDIVFYGIAGYEGYKFGFRNLDVELEQAIEAGHAPVPTFAKLRLPIVIVLVVTLAIGGYFVSRGSSGQKTFNYDSGAKKASGELVNGKENGLWETWWENGNPQTQGYYVDGDADSTWKFFNEEGVLVRSGAYHLDVKTGIWSDYHDDGSVSETGTFRMGRRHGMWTYTHKGGIVRSKGQFLLDLMDGPWESFYVDGKPSFSGSYKKGIPTGQWTYWNPNGSKSQELNYSDEKNVKILNTWKDDGSPEIIKGNGVLKVLSDKGQVIATGQIKDGFRVGIWKKSYESGSRQEEGEYKDGIYYVSNAWSADGLPMVVNGKGTFESHHEDGSVNETGAFENGLKTGKWTAYFIGGDSTASESTFVKGKLDGYYMGFFDTGGLNLEGMFHNDLRVGEWKWYSNDGTIESKVTFVDGKKDGHQLFFSGDGSVLRKEVYKNGEFVESTLGSD